MLGFAIGHCPGKMNDRTGDLGCFCTQGELISLHLQEGRELSLIACSGGPPQQDLDEGAAVCPGSHPGMWWGKPGSCWG